MEAARTGGAARPAALAATAALLLSAGCGGGEATGREGPLVVAYSAELQTLNPVVSTDQNANELIYYLLFTPLVAYDSAFRVRPWLAESWELSKEEVVFTLRDGVRWHDGEPVTAADVVFTFELMTDPEVASPLGAAYLSEVASAEALGPRRVRFAFERPHASPLEDFFWPPVPRHVLEGVPAAELARHPFGRRPVGSGPYRLVEWDVGEGLRFRGREEFPEALGGPPEIRDVYYRILPENTVRLRELLTGRLHVDGPLAPSEAERVRASDAARLEAFPWRKFTYVGWNGRRAPFDDARVRRALTMALERGELLRAALYGFGSVAAGPIPPWHPYSPDLDPLPHAPDSARALLERAGWRDRDGDGVREREGRPFRFELLAAARNPTFADLVQMIQAQLSRVGVEVEPRLLEWQTVLARHRGRDFDAVLTNWVLDSFRVDPRPLFHSRQVEVEGSANRSSYANPVADSLMELGVRARDTARAARVWAEFARVLQRDQPLTFLFWDDELAGVDRSLEGVRMDARGELVTLPRWSWRGDAGAGAGTAAAGAPEEAGDGGS